MSEQSPHDWKDAAASLCAHVEPHLAVVLRKASDDFYAGLLDDVQAYLRDNADFNLSSLLAAARRETDEAREALASVAEALGTHRSGWPCGPTVAEVASAAIAAVQKLKVGQLEVNTGELLDFRDGLLARAEWLKSEYLKGGDFAHLSARETECAHIAAKLTERFSIAKAEGRS